MFKMEKVISLVLAFVLLLGALPVAYATDEVEPVEIEVVHDHDHDKGICPMSTDSGCPVCGGTIYSSRSSYNQIVGSASVCYYAVEETVYYCLQHGNIGSPSYYRVPAGHNYQNGRCLTCGRAQ